MKYDLSKSYDNQRLLEYHKRLLKKKSVVEFKEVFKNRTITQNAYLHVLFSLWGLHHGYLMNETKQLVKEQLGYSYEKKGRVFYEETSRMTTKELTIFIDKFRDWSNITCGLYLPTPDEYKIDYVRISNEIKNYY